MAQTVQNHSFLGLYRTKDGVSDGQTAKFLPYYKVNPPNASSKLCEFISSFVMFPHGRQSLSYNL